jgi:hypothetical protein
MNARLLAYPSQVRRSRTDQQWRDMYARAMAKKREAAAKAQPPVIVFAKLPRKRRGK